MQYTKYTVHHGGGRLQYICLPLARCYKAPEAQDMLASSAVNLIVQYACLLFATHHGRHKLAHAMHEASSMLGGMTRHGRSLEFPAGRGACTTAARVPRDTALCQSLFCLLHTHDRRIGLAGTRVVCFACLHWMVMISIFFDLCFDTYPILCIEGISFA